MIGSSGVLVHFGALWGFYKILALSFPLSQGLATFVAMTSNFFLNNLLTYRDQSLRGWRQVWGLISFYLVCGLGVLGNVGVATTVFEVVSIHTPDYSWIISGGAGALISVVWNYAATALITWRRKK